MPTAVDRPPEEAAEDSSLARGLRVFLAVADRGEVRADELSMVLETPLSTIYRYLRTLTEFGFVERCEAGYRVGPRLRITGGATVTSEELIRIAEPVLTMLVEDTGETAVIARRVGVTAVCLHEIQSGHALRVSWEPGMALPLHAGALSRVLLANAPADVRNEVLAAAPDSGRLRRDLVRAAADGIARSEGEVFAGTVMIAVPVMRNDGIVAALGVLAPAQRADLGWRRRTSRLLLDAARVADAAFRGAARE